MVLGEEEGCGKGREGRRGRAGIETKCKEREAVTQGVGRGLGFCIYTWG